MSFKNFEEEIKRLVDSFERDKPIIRANGMNEAALRLEYLDPFFSALGWDVGNRGLAPFGSRDVLVEPPTLIRGSQKRPDYLFRINGIDKFICEAKKPFDRIDQHFFQVQNYVYNMRLWFGVLCDFEHFIAFLVGAQPTKNRPFPPLEGWRLSYWQYADNAQRIWDHFSREAVGDAALERLAQGAAKVYRAGKQGWLIKPDRNQRIDGKFLSFLEESRADLAKSLKNENDFEWTTQSLTEATQKIIDRLLFQRICEDRHIDVGRSLSKILNEWEDRKRLKGQLWPQISSNFGHFKRAFNGGLYGRHGSAPHFVDELIVSDKWLSQFIDELTRDDSPYLFSVIPVEILGSVYERFLASIVLPSGRVEKKPEIRKDGGVYYTPKHIVKFIVRSTVSSSIADKTPDEVSKLRVLDPACGSGSFLLGAFEALCEYYVAWFLRHPESCTEDNCYRVDGDLHLTTGFKRRILKNNIYGVDLDPQAVEVTQMSLYLKVLEGESRETLTRDHALFPKETYLPDLDSNIKHGNSLIGTDAAEDFGGSSKELTNLSAFDWEAEFPHIMKRGKFDVVIGNPPYLNVDDTWGKNDYRLQYLKRHYQEVYADKTDILFYFLQRAVSLSKGSIGMIVSRAFLEAYKAQKLRSWLAANTKSVRVIDFQNQTVFENVGITTCITLFTKTEKNKDAEFYRALQKKHEEISPEESVKNSAKFQRIVVPHKRLAAGPWLFGATSDEEIIEKIDGGHPKLGDVLMLGKGMETGCNGAFGKLPVSVISDWHLPKKLWRWRARNSDIQQWVFSAPQEVLLYVEDFEKFSNLPDEVKGHLKSHKKDLEDRAAFIRGNCEWWKYTWPLHKDHYKQVKILCPYLAKNNRFAIDEEGRYLGLTDTTVIFDGDQDEDIRYFLALLNSNILTWRFRFIGKLKSGGIREYFWNSISKLPIPRMNMKDAVERKLHDEIVDLAKRQIDLHRQLGAAKGKETNAIQRTVDAVTASLEKLVGRVYGLNESEFAYIEKTLLDLNMSEN